MKHKWHKEICAWANGAEIECRWNTGDGWSSWVADDEPDWRFGWEYRIKPQPKEPQYLQVDIIDGELTISAENLFDKNITGKFKIKLEE